MGLWAQQGRARPGVSPVMQPRDRPLVPAHTATIDSATLYLCRQGPRWVVVLESPRATGAIPFHHSGRDSHDARFELLTTVRQACPDAAIISTDGAITSEDYEWRIEVRGVAGRLGELGLSLHRMLCTGLSEGDVAPLQMIGRRCHWGLSSSPSGRPRRF
jgi:hypothetical protein